MAMVQLFAQAAHGTLLLQAGLGAFIGTLAYGIHGACWGGVYLALGSSTDEWHWQHY